MNQGAQVLKLVRQNERNYAYYRLALTTIFGLCFILVCLKIFSPIQWFNYCWSFAAYDFSVYMVVFEYHKAPPPKKNSNFSTFLKFVFLAFFLARMTKIDILNQKLIVPDDYQQFWVHFEWFLALFRISVEKWLLL